jgi:hypothetical protein
MEPGPPPTLKAWPLPPVAKNNDESAGCGPICHVASGVSVYLHGDITETGWGLTQGSRSPAKPGCSEGLLCQLRIRPLEMRPQLLSSRLRYAQAIVAVRKHGPWDRHRLLFRRLDSANEACAVNGELDYIVVCRLGLLSMEYYTHSVGATYREHVEPRAEI